MLRNNCPSTDESDHVKNIFFEQQAIGYKTLEKHQKRERENALLVETDKKRNSQNENHGTVRQSP